MFESRLRSKVKSKRYISELHRGHGYISSIYLNRSNRSVLGRLLRGEESLYVEQLRLYKIEMVQRHQALVALATVTNTTMGISDIIDRRSNQESQMCILGQIQEIDSGLLYRRWKDRSKQITEFGKVQTLIFANKLLRRKTEIFSIDADRCNKCFNVFTFDVDANTNVCLLCANVHHVLFASEDISQDVVIRTTGDAGCLPIHRVVNSPKFVDDKTNSQRVLTYRRYLLQFLNTAPPIPIDVLTLVYKHLSSIHLMSSIRCRPTPVSTILKTHGMSTYITQALRISKIFNGDAIPSLSMQLIDRLVDRFKYIIIVIDSQQLKKKLFNFDFITAFCLRFEPDNINLARLFHIPKTAIASSMIDTTITILTVELVRISPISMNWGTI